MLIAKTVIFEVPMLEKLPIPQITKAWISSLRLKNLRMSVIEPAKYAIIKPMIIKVVMFFMRELNASITKRTTTAPMKAARLTPIVDHQPNDDTAAPEIAPVRSITIPTPKLAPLLIPSMEGSARGFLNSVCINKPATARAEPAKRAVNACGSL